MTTKVLVEEDEGFLTECVVISPRRLHTCFLWCNKVVDKTLGNHVIILQNVQLPSPGHSTEAQVLVQCIVRVFPRPDRTDLSQESMVATLYAVLFPFQQLSPRVDLYGVWYYHVLKQRNRQWLQRKVQHEIQVSRLHTLGYQSDIPDKKHVSTPTYSDSAPYYQTLRLSYDFSYMNLGLFLAPLSLHT